MDESSADAGEGIGEDAQQQQEQNQSRFLQEEQLQHQDEEIGMIIHEEIRSDSPSRGDRRREYRRRMTLDPLVDLLDDNVFIDASDNYLQNEAEENDSEHQIVQDQEGSEEGIGTIIDAAGANNNGNETAASNNDFSGAAIANDRSGNFSELELLGELLGRYARNGSNRSGNDSMSSDGEDGVDDKHNNSEPLQPPRNHSYLPTAQPLYPEEWIPAGKHRHRLSRGDSVASDLFLEELDNEDNIANEMNDDDAESEGSKKNLDGNDRDIHSPSYYSIPEPPTLLRSRFNEAERDILYEALDMTISQTENTADLSTLAIMEMEDIVLFPGSVIPLRLRDRNWVNYLGQLIDDARGLYGSHQGTAGGMGEVRIIILPRVSPGTRRTRRHPRESGGRTGRWRVDLIRRGVTGVRGLTRRRYRSESTETELDDNLSRNEAGDERTGQHSTSMDVREDDGTSQRQNRSSQTSSSDEESEADVFRLAAAAARSPDDDPLIGRIGTMATITFTHEENTSAANPDESLVAGANPVTDTESPSPRHAQRPSSMVWRDRGGELVVTVLGTNRVRLIRSTKDDNSPQAWNVQIPLYSVEEIHDASTALPPPWMLRLPGDIRCSIAGPADELRQVNEEEGEDAEEDTNCTGDNYNRSIRNLSLRSSVPVIASQAIWPWILCRKIYNMIRENDEFQGLCKILHLAAGLRFAVVDKHNENVLTAATDGVAMVSSSSQFQVVDPSAFANWISSNMPLSQNDRLDLLEMICTVEQLRYIIQKLEDKKKETTLRCKHCGAAISQMRHVFSVGGSEGTTGAYVNEYGVVHQTMTLRKVDGHSVVCIGQPSTKDSWFPGYSWTIAYCSICSDHLGWRFRSVGNSDEDDPDRPHTFWGFSSITTDNHVAPMRVSFHTQRALRALLQHDQDFVGTSM